MTAPVAKSIPLSVPIAGHGGPVREWKLREPTGAELFRFGEPFVYARNPDGSIFTVENNDVIKLYAEALTVAPDAIFLDQLALADALKVRSAVIDFFVTAQASIYSPPATSSSGTTASPTPPAPPA
jgi:hypothetical protein